MIVFCCLRWLVIVVSNKQEISIVVWIILLWCNNGLDGDIINIVGGGFIEYYS
jgi:hypothetical protein